MKSILLTTAKLLLIIGTALLVVWLIKPVTIPPVELKPLATGNNDQVQDNTEEIYAPQLEKEEDVAILFGWLPTPKPTPRPTPRRTTRPTTPPTPSPPVELWLLYKGGKAVQNDITNYWCSNIRGDGGFWINFVEPNNQGYQLLEFIDEGLLVLHNNQRKIIRSE